jgi:DNA polymerase-3 subunit alpha
MAMVALYRPGPMSQIPEYIGRKNNPSKINYLDPRMKEYLGRSYGLMVYQDDVFLTAINIAGYSWEEADKFRKAVGKKIPSEMERQRQKFIEGAVKNGVPHAKAEELFHLIEPFSGYGFNKAHAASYGMVAYQTAYMKANYPVEYMTALLTAESSDAEKISAAVNECRRMGIKVLPPDINESDVGFTIVKDKKSLDGRAIRFGLSAVKNVGDAAITAILEARAVDEFRSFPDFLSRVDSRRVNKKVLESLIKVGALSLFGTRAALLSSLDQVRERVTKPAGLKGQQGLFAQEEMGKTTKVQPRMQLEVPEFSDEELQALERQLLGFSLSARPLGEVIGPLAFEATHKIYEISPLGSFGEMVRIAAVVSEVRIIVTKRSNQEMAFVRMEDETGSIDVIVFPRIFERTRNLWVSFKPLLISGKVDSREEAPSLIAETVESPGEVVRPKQVYINVPEGTSIDQLKTLKELLSQNPGNQDITLVFKGKAAQNVKLPIKIQWSESLALRISQLLEEMLPGGVE